MIKNLILVLVDMIKNRVMFETVKFNLNFKEVKSFNKESL